MWPPLRARLVVDFEALPNLVEQSDKQRYELSPDLSRIRARQGRSVAVDLELTPCAPPALLYHGTVERSLAAIMAEGLRKMRRHHVHLSPDAVAVERVGARRGKPVILIIDPARMQADNCLFYVTENRVWLTETVAPLYLRRLER